MSEIIKKSFDTIKEGFESLKTIKQDKREYKEFLQRIKALPDEYSYAYDKMTNYMWSFSGGGNGYDMIALHTGLLELFEAGAAEGKTVYEVTGEDVASFCDELLLNAKTYIGNQHDKLNKDIAKKLKSNEQL